MGRKKPKKNTPPPTPEATTSMGSLLSGLGFAASEPSPEAPAAAAPPSAPASGLDLSTSRNLKLRIEKKGRRGKSVTILEGVPAAQAAAVAKALRKELGCGVSDKGESITVQGSQSDRVRAWLLGQGAPRVKGV